MQLDRKKTKEIVEFLVTVNEYEIIDVEEMYQFLEDDSNTSIEISSDTDFEFPSGLKHLDNIIEMTIEAPITKLSDELIKMKNLTVLNILDTEIKSFSQIPIKFFDRKEFEIFVNDEIYIEASFAIGKGVFGFDEGRLKFTSKDSDIITIPTFIHDDYGMYPGIGELSVKEFKKVVAGELELEDAKSFSCGGVYGDGDLLFDTNQSGDREAYWSWKGETPTHFCHEY